MHNPRGHSIGQGIHTEIVGIFAGPHRSHSGAMAGLLQGLLRVACVYMNGL